MISVTLSYLVCIYLMLMLCPIFGAWMWSESRRRRRERAAFRHVIHCRVCAFDFEEKDESILPRCPRCLSLNERHRIPRL